MRPTSPETPSPVDKPSESPPPVHPPSATVPVSPSEPPSRESPAPSSQAVVALLDTADARAQAGNLDSAAAVVERALRLEPHNPMLWHRLASLRLQQGQYAQAANLAVKSNALASHNRQLQTANWDLIARAKDKLGDAEAARAARAKARTLQ